MATNVPLDVSEKMIARHLLRDVENGGLVEDPPISALVNAVMAAREKAESAATLFDAIKGDKTQTPEANAIRSRETILKIGAEVSALLDKARDKARAEIARVELETSAPPVPRDPMSMQIEGEIRAMLRTGSEKDRGEIIGKALASDDDLTIGALLRGPAKLSGLTDSQRTMYHETWRRKRLPTETARLARITKAVADTERAGKAFLEFIRTLTESPTARVAAAARNRANAAAQAAAS